jgi:peptide/nickel transport system permease protein
MSKPGLRNWLLAEVPGSRRQARLGQAYRVGRLLWANQLTRTGLLIVLGLVVVGLLAPVLPLASPVATDLAARLQPPGAGHWLGTDELGRDILARIAFGARVTLEIVVLVAIIVAPIGLLVGTVAGYAGGMVETILMRVTDVFMAFPKLVLALAFIAALKPGIENAVVAIALTSWPAYARIARAQTLQLRNADFIKAVRLQGGSPLHILWHHILPLCTSFVVVQLTLDMAGIVLTAAGLGFLGLGAPPPTPEWGAMVSAGRAYVFEQWWVAAIPGLMILLVSLGFNVLGDGLRDVLDPRHS